MRCGIDGLAGIITDKYKDGFILLYKRIEKGNLQWPRNQEEVKKLTSQELRWLLEGLSIQQPKAIKPAQTGCLI